jgi:hypothetical protein
VNIFDMGAFWLCYQAMDPKGRRKCQKENNICREGNIDDLYSSTAWNHN